MTIFRAVHDSRQPLPRSARSCMSSVLCRMTAEWVACLADHRASSPFQQFVNNYITPMGLVRRRPSRPIDHRAVYRAPRRIVVDCRPMSVVGRWPPGVGNTYRPPAAAAHISPHCRCNDFVSVCLLTERRFFWSASSSSSSSFSSGTMGPAPVGVHCLSCNELPSFAILDQTVQLL